MGDRKVCITLKGKFSARIADTALPGDLTIMVKDDVGESIIEITDQADALGLWGVADEIDGPQGLVIIQRAHHSL